jgi:hypothetical protein
MTQVATDTGTGTAVAVYPDHGEADTAVKALQHGGFDMRKLSIVGADYHSEEDVVGYYNTGDRMKSWGTNGAFWGGIWGLFFGAAFFIIPGIGPLVAAGPIVVAIVSALEGAVLVGALGAFGAGLVGLGVPKNSVVQYETAVKAGKFLVIAHGSRAEANKAKDILANAGLELPDMHSAVPSPS